jgi:hypothetical protein
MEIPLRAARLSDGLPDYLKVNQQAIMESEDAVFHALALEYLGFIRTDMPYAGADAVPENAFGHALFDHAALEFLLPQYRPEDPFEKKREAIKNADLFWSKAGTAQATQKIAEIFFGVGALEEWFDYGGTPHFFRIRVDSFPPDWAQTLEFLKACDAFKRLTAHLEKLRFVLKETPEPLRFMARRVEHRAEFHEAPSNGVKIFAASRRIEYWLETHAANSGITARAVYDWKEPDETAAGYIRNKPGLAENTRVDQIFP